MDKVSFQNGFLCGLAVPSAFVGNAKQGGSGGGDSGLIYGVPKSLNLKGVVGIEVISGSPSSVNIMGVVVSPPIYGIPILIE